MYLTSQKNRFDRQHNFKQFEKLPDYDGNKLYEKFPDEIKNIKYIQIFKIQDSLKWIIIVIIII